MHGHSRCLTVFLLPIIFDEDPPFVNSANENGYDESLATIKGRFWYIQLKKRF
jgi:hypothetical protein